MTEPRRASRRRTPDAAALALHTEYRRTADPRLRDRLVIGYAGIVKHIVYRKLRELPAWCEVDDLLSCGLEALIAAVDRFDPERGATFEQYAWTRVHGAVLDELRRQDWAPRPLLLDRFTTERIGVLSPREREVLDLLAKGLTGEEAATQLSLSPETIRTHVRNAMDKLEAHTRVHAVAIALRQGEI